MRHVDRNRLWINQWLFLRQGPNPHRQSDFLSDSFLWRCTDGTNIAALSMSSSMGRALQQRQQKTTQMQIGKPTRKQPSTGASLNTGWTEDREDSEPDADRKKEVG